MGSGQREEQPLKGTAQDTLSKSITPQTAYRMQSAKENCALAQASATWAFASNVLSDDCLCSTSSKALKYSLFNQRWAYEQHSTCL